MSSSQTTRSPVVVVTGGANGIGRAAVTQMLADGARVVVGDIDLTATEDLASDISKRGCLDRFAFRYCDVSSERDIERLIRYAVERFGRVDAFVNNAAVVGAFTTLVETSESDWDRTLELNLRSVFFGIKHAARQMQSQGGGGSIVNVASVAGMTGAAAGAPYSAAKAGVISLTKTSAVQLGRDQIRVNAIAPGPIVTPLTHNNVDPAGLHEIAETMQPLSVAGTPELVAPAIAFLCSPRAAFVSGEVLTVDGAGMAFGGFDLTTENSRWAEAMLERARSTGIASFDDGSGRRAAGRTEYPTLASIEPPLAARSPQVVAVTNADASPGREIADVLAARGDIVLRQEGQLSEADWQHWASAISHGHGGPDVVIHASTTVDPEAQLWRTSNDTVAATMAESIANVCHAVRHVVPTMFKKRGRLIVIGHGISADPEPRRAMHCGMSWAIDGIVQSLASELPPGMFAVTVEPPQLDAADENERPAHLRAWANALSELIEDLDAADNGKPLRVTPSPRNHSGEPSVSTDG